MTAFAQKQLDPRSSWQLNFASMLPELQSRLSCEFRNLDPNSQEEAVCEGLAHSLIAFVRLHESKRAHVASSFTLVLYAARQVRHGRPAAGSMNCRDPLSRYAQVRNRIHGDSQAGNWLNDLVLDKRAGILDQVAMKIDFADWFATLSTRMKSIARDLGLGCRTREVAEKYAISPSRVSQMRKCLQRSWSKFQGETVPAET